jgi:exodeoxyribonuclease X
MRDPNRSGDKPPDQVETRTPLPRTQPLARRLIPGLPSYRLGSLVEEFNLAEGMPSDLKPHRATYDALMAARLFIYMAAQLGSGPLSLEVLRDQPPRGGTHEAAALF